MNLYFGREQDIGHKSSKMKIEKLFREFVDTFYFAGIIILGFIQVYILSEIVIGFEEIYLRYLVGILGVIGIIAFISKLTLDELDKLNKKKKKDEK